jgi:outer membrane protein assembly factor BamA
MSSALLEKELNSASFLGEDDVRQYLSDIRAFPLRGIGPGSYHATGRYAYIDHTGDVKLEANAEWRFPLVGQLSGALFVDAGNIWTIRDYKEQPGGQFRFDTCWEQIAVAYGLGIRLNLSYFLLRFDAGMKAINPAYQDAKRHYPIIHPNFKRDFAFHFAVGLPF